MLTVIFKERNIFKIVREKNPDIPVIIMSGISGRDYEQRARRQKIIKKTYDNAVAAGDENVYYIDGRTIYAPVGRSLCTVDHIHPNDIGFLMMANAYGNVMENILNKKGFICDMDGVIYHGSQLLPGVQEFVEWMQSIFNKK